MKLEALTPGASVRGVVAGGAVTVVSVERHGPDAVTLVFRNERGAVDERLLYRGDEDRLELAEEERPWSFDGDGALFRLAAEAQRISLAHLFDPLLAVQTSQVDPLPHQITAVYEAMLPRQPLRFLLADDPGAGKTIMAGLLIKELLARGDAGRCLVVCPGSLVEQWQQELSERFGLDFAVLTRDQWDAAASGNWFLETPQGIVRMDMLARNDEMQARLRAPDCAYDLVVCDEAHKMSAHYFGGEARYTARYRLGRLLSERTRHLLLMTATPHRGIEADYQLFLALLDRDAFEGKHRKDDAPADTSHLMRRVVKENLVRFDGRPLFPERYAHTVPYRLSGAEMRLYEAVTDYVREEFNRADAVGGEKKRTVGFALTVLQRRLASSPEAIHRSLVRRRERLETRRDEIRSGRNAASASARRLRLFDPEDLDELYDLPDDEREEAEGEVLDQATAAQTISELEAEIETLRRLERVSAEVRGRGDDTKWLQLRGVLEGQVFAGIPHGGAAEPRAPYGAGPIPPPAASPSQKLVLFTEHRATLEYLERRIGAWIGRPEAIAVIHGGLAREVRREAQERFVQDPEVRILLATDAAGEGINLQRAHLMVNYDLPWNPNRLEQRFGRIHRIGQREVCHLWNMFAEGTREGEVYGRLLTKLETARRALGGQVFDVLGHLKFEGQSLRDLLLEAVRYGNLPEVRDRLERAVEGAVDADRLRSLIERQALAPETMDTRRVAEVRADLERAEARRLQPQHVGAFFRQAFAHLGGACRQRETGRYELTQVPAAIRGNGAGAVRRAAETGRAPLRAGHFREGARAGRRETGRRPARAGTPVAGRGHRADAFAFRTRAAAGRGRRGSVRRGRRAASGGRSRTRGGRRDDPPVGSAPGDQPEDGFGGDLRRRRGARAAGRAVGGLPSAGGGRARRGGSARAARVRMGLRGDREDRPQPRRHPDRSRASRGSAGPETAPRGEDAPGRQGAAHPRDRALGPPGPGVEGGRSRGETGGGDELRRGATPRG